MGENITAVAIQHDSDSEPIVHLSDGSSIALSELIVQALKWQHAKSPGAVDRAMNREQHANERMRSAEPGVPDAALAAIERVRALHHETYANTSDEAWKRNQICAHCGYVFPCDTRAALDGAPEPEVKP